MLQDASGKTESLLDVMPNKQHKNEVSNIKTIYVVSVYKVWKI